jgi:hypothetical protein
MSSSIIEIKRHAVLPNLLCQLTISFSISVKAFYPIRSRGAESGDQKAAVNDNRLSGEIVACRFDASHVYENIDLPHAR